MECGNIVSGFEFIFQLELLGEAAARPLFILLIDHLNWISFSFNTIIQLTIIDSICGNSKRMHGKPFLLLK